ncbi:MAG: hypothetical protein JNK84_17865 [Phreatobacter sp.]|uniref:hypothetical protein n=1 Tax=Phreatobacter sp. TaxID=1966341 RepID=UPI001A5D34FF|nr:hypothetical protein [Phreatobacter sp.]MBL8570940.1 hypothetical protein [Phreatobacter sp.]
MPAALPSLRRQAEDAIDRLLALLDAIDGDTDLEDDELEDGGDREPSLGWRDYPIYQSGNMFGGCDDLEEEYI